MTLTIRTALAAGLLALATSPAAKAQYAVPVQQPFVPGVAVYAGPRYVAPVPPVVVVPQPYVRPLPPVYGPRVYYGPRYYGRPRYYGGYRYYR